MSGNKLKESFEVESKFEALYTGGKIEWSEDGETLFCQNNDCITAVSVTKGSIKFTLGKPKDNEDEDKINTFACSNDGQFVVTHHKSSLFKLWNVKEERPLKLWKSIHNGPVPAIVLSSDASNMASGGIDGTVRVWDLKHHSCTQSLKGTQGVVSTLCYSNTNDNLLFASADDYVIHGWNTETGQEEISLQGHMSKVTSLTFHKDGIHALSSGRDKVLILWDLKKQVSVRTLPVFECVEGAFIIPNDAKIPVSKGKNKSAIYAASAGDKGVIKIWEMKSGRMVFEQSNSLIPAAKDEDSAGILHLLYNESSNSVNLVSASRNILIYSLDMFECKKQLVGYIDEILDIAYLGKSESHLAVATNTSDIKLFDLSTMNCKILCGHTNIVYSLATSPVNRNILVSASKDHSIRLWLMDEETKTVNCIGLGTGHQDAVSCIVISQTVTKFLVSASRDFTLKLWELSENLVHTGTEETLTSIIGAEAHKDYDINSITVSPNDKLIATASQDKTAKLWSTDNLQLLGVLRGHRRGVWCARFSPIDQVIATSSADCTIKMWSLSELNCLKTFEGHECAVLKMEFVSRGMQILSSGADGLIKLWSVKTSDCVTTLDQHNDRVWSLAVNKSESHFISGGNDSLLVIWRDTTLENKEKARILEEELTRDEQKLANALQAEKLSKALRLALRLEKPMHVLRIIEALMKKSEEELISTICDLKPSQQEELLKTAIIWNTNARNFQAAQVVINAVLNEIEFENLESVDLRSKLESMIPYTDRHFKRLTKLHQDLHLLTYTISSMKAHTIANEPVET